MAECRKARKRIDVSVGESVRIVRELQELSQNQLAELTGTPQSTISTVDVGAGAPSRKRPWKKRANEARMSSAVFTQM
jgi:DNA-binding transcriptional regulator YiaG